MKIYKINFIFLIIWVFFILYDISWYKSLYIHNATNKTSEIALKKYSDKLCLPNEGLYKIIPKSCYLFPQNEYFYDTNNNKEQNTFELKNVELKTKGKITLDDSAIKKLEKKT